VAERLSNDLLAQRARDGDRETFAALLESCRDGICAYVEARLGKELRRRVDVDDVVQDAALRAFLSIHTFEWRGEKSFLRWLCAIAENVVRDLARARRVEELPLRREVPGAISSPSKGPRREERFHRLLRAYEKLDPDHREVIRLARLEGLTVKEISERMGRSSSAVRHLLLRALRELREFFGGETESVHLPEWRLSEGGRE
jgi:RNA polymerase sigma-70 factor (ECF subfamily)